MRFRGQRPTGEDQKHIQEHFDGLLRTSYHMMPESNEESNLLDEMRECIEKARKIANGLFQKTETIKI